MSSKRTSKRNYHRRTTTKKNSAPIGWLGGGILIGLLVPGLLYLHSKQPSKEKILSEIKIAESDPDVPKSNKMNTIKKHPPQQKQSATHSHYDFYHMLSTEEGGAASQAEETSDGISVKFSLEAGRFRHYSDADQLRAQLLLMGVDEVAIAKSSQDHHVEYRVTIGPFDSRTQASETQKKLKENAIQSNLIVG